MKHKFCKNTSIECKFHKKGQDCSECVDITDATNFLLKELKPESGTLKTGAMNNDYAAYLMTLFLNQHIKPKTKKNDCLHIWDEGNHGVHKCTKCGKFNC